MKKTFVPTRALCLFLLFSISFNLSAQTSFENSLANEFCDAFTSSAGEITKDDMAKVGFLILPLLSKYKEQIKSEWKLDIDKAEDLRKASEKIGGISALNCASFREFVQNNMSEIQEKSGRKKTFTGKILKIEGTPFSYFLVQNTAGKTDKIYWMDFFPGAEQISLKSNTIINKTVAITYREMEVYDAPSKEYRMIKVASKFVFNP